MEYIYSVFEVEQILEDFTDELYHTCPRNREFAELFLRYAERFGYEAPKHMSSAQMLDEFSEYFDYTRERDDC